MGRKRIVLTPEEEKEVVKLFNEGLSVRRIARATGRGDQLVSRVLDSRGLSPQHRATQKARETGQTYNRARRVALLDRVIAHAAGLLPKLDKPGSVYNYAMGLAVLYDKRRQEDIPEDVGAKGAILELVGRITRQETAEATAGAEETNTDTGTVEDVKISA